MTSQAVNSVALERSFSRDDEAATSDSTIDRVRVKKFE